MSFRILVSSTGHCFEIEEGENILEASLRQGLVLPYGCRDGNCGNCAGDILKGTAQCHESELSGVALDLYKNGKTLFCKSVALSDLEIQVRELMVADEIEVKTLPCRVVSLELLTHDIMKMCIKLPENERLQFLAGQYIEFILKDGKRRAFSIANAPHDDNQIELHIRHVPDGHFGDYVFDGMKAKEILKMQGPLGSYYLREDSTRPIILMGGGTGFAPLKGMLEHAFYIGINRPVHLFCGARARRDLYMHELVSDWQTIHQNLQYTPVLSAALADDNWSGKTGLVHEAVVNEYENLADYDVYMSGPPPMIKAGMDLFYKHGLPEDRIFSDSFEYSDDALKAMGIKKPDGY